MCWLRASLEPARAYIKGPFWKDWTPESKCVQVSILRKARLTGLGLMLMATSCYSDPIHNSVGSTRSIMMSLQWPLLAYRLDTGRFPSTEEGLSSLQKPSLIKPNKVYLESNVPVADIWGNAFLYFSPGKTPECEYELISLGQDHRPGGMNEAADLVYCGASKGGKWLSGGP